MSGKTHDGIPGEQHLASSTGPHILAPSTPPQRTVDNGGELTKGQRWRKRFGELGCSLLCGMAVALLTFGIDQAVA
ncbi:hypothetical protein Q7P35_003334 [Cladosporium inversicolor]